MPPFRLAELHPIYIKHLEFLEAKSKQTSLWQVEAQETLNHGLLLNADDTLQALHKIQRVRQVFLAGLENNLSFRTAYDDWNLNLWHDFTSPPVLDDLQQGLAERLYNPKPAQNATILLLVCDGARRLSEILLEKCHINQVPTFVYVADTNFTNLVFNHIDDQAIKNLADDFVQISSFATTRMEARAGLSDGPRVEQDETKNALYNQRLVPYRKRLASGDLFYTLTIVPTRKMAELDGMDYDDYIKLFFEMCDQPWAHIGLAQEKLISELNKAKKLRFTNDDGTDITLGINGFTFCNSLVAKNVPGSEVFSGPERESLNGIIVSKGRFTPPHNCNAVIENLTMEFEKGRLVRWHAEKGQKHFEDAINVDEGAKYAGEIGIGTNPHLRRHVLNDLLVEKIGGSFHIALGRAYSYTTYEGTPVAVNNGNLSEIHWDITTMLYGKGGCMYIDGRKIMENGLFLDPALDILNRGWAAVPEAERPAYWKNHPSVLANLQIGPVRSRSVRSQKPSGKGEPSV